MENSKCGEDIEKLKLLCTADGNIKLCSCWENNLIVSRKKLNRELPYNPAIPFLGIYMNKLKGDSCL